jgi:hypothetical protein
LWSYTRTIYGILRTKVLLVENVASSMDVGHLALASTQDGTISWVMVEHQARVFVDGHVVQEHIGVASHNR